MDGVSNGRQAVRVVVLLTAVLATLVVGPPASAADEPDLDVTITALSPATLTPGDPVVMTGTITNNNDFAWGNLQAYLVIPRAPFTTRAQLETAIGSNRGYTGERVVEDGTFDSVGDLAPGATVAFRVRVPWDDLLLTGAEGIYPVGVQILGTLPDGTRSTTAISRATTFAPLVEARGEPVAASIVWPFVMPQYRGVTGDLVDPDKLVQSVGPGGQLRNLLDLASTTSARSSTLLLDPALLDGLADLIANRHVSEGDQLDEREQRQVSAFLDDLRALARRGSTWVLGYGRPDELAITRRAAAADELRDAVARATEDALATHSVPGRAATWLTRRGVTDEVLSAVRGDGDTPVIVASGDLPTWDRRDGSLVTYTTDRGPLPLLVTDDLDAGVPGLDSVVTLRQRILSEAALAVLQRGVDPDSRADAVAIVSPTWDPGPGATGLSATFDADYVEAWILDDLLTRPRSAYDGVIAPASAETLAPRALTAVADLVSAGQTLTDLTTGNDDLVAALARDAAPLLGVRWRSKPDDVVAIAGAREGEVRDELSRLTIGGPPSFTLSGTEGRFPLTISNATSHTVEVGVRIDSSNPALTIPDVDPVEIGAGERRTLTVNVDVGRQNTSTVTATLVSADGQLLGDPAVFNVRSSNVGVLIWIAMGLAGLLVVVAIVRRFVLRRGRGATPDPVVDGHD